MGDMTDLATRYGTARASRGRLVGAIGAAVAAVVLGVVVWSFVDQSAPQVRSQLLRYDVVGPHLAVADLTVVRSDSSVEATCLLQAVAGDHTVVGEVSQVVDSGPVSQTLRIELRTEREAVTVRPQGCTTPDQPRPR